MAGTTYNIRIILTSNARRTGEDLGDLGDNARGAGRGLGDAGEGAKSAGREFATLGGLVKEAAANFAGYLTAQAVMEGLAKAAEFAKETILGFDEEMTQSLAIMSDVSQQTRDSMEATAREVAVKYNTAVNEVAQGYYFLASAGYDAATSQKALGQVTAFAKAGMIDMEQATELAADAQNAMGLKSDDAGENLAQLTRITDVLTKANIDANGSVVQFAEALTNKAAASSRLAGISLEHTVAVLEAFAAQGLKGLKAGEAFSIILRDLQEKARTNAEAFENLGITVFTAEGQFAGFDVIIGQIEKALAGMSVEQAGATLATLGFTAEGANYIKTLIGMSGEIVKYEGKLRDAGGATQQIAEKQMASMVEQLKHLRALAADAALSGFDLMIQALTWLRGQFAPALENGVEALREMVTYARPGAELLAKLGGATVVGGLMALATALNAVTGFLKENEQIMQVLGAGVLVVLIAKIGVLINMLYGAGAAALSLSADLAAFAAFNLAGQFDAWVASMRAASAAGGTLSGVMVGLRSILGSTVVQVGVLTALILAFTQSFMETNRQAEEFGKTLTQGMDPTNLYDIAAAFKNVQREHDALVNKIQSENSLGQWLGGMADLLIPFHDVEDSVQDMGAKADQASDKLSQLNKTLTESGGTINSMARELSPAQRELEASAGKFSMFNDQARRLQQAQAATEVRNISAELARLAVAAQIDITRPVEEWKDQLRETYQLTRNASPAVLQLHDAFKTVADSASDAADAVKAYEQALNALVGIHISSQQAENQFAASLDTVREKVGAGVNLMDAYNAKNREARDAILGAADGAIAHAVSVFQETNSLEKANAVLTTHRDQLIATMMQTGMTRQAAEQYLNTLGLTPENIKTTAQLNKEQAEGAANQLINRLDEAARPRTGSIHIAIDAALANLNTLQSKLNYVASLGRSGDLGGMGYAMGRTLAGNANGGITLHQYAAGGMENHLAQITRPGTWRLWGEPETGGEAYIPLAMAKRGRSTQILEAVANIFGYGLVKQLDGGLLSYARELQQMLRSGGPNLYEDLTFQGMSANGSRWNDTLADLFWAENKGKDWGAGGWERSSTLAFVDRLLAGQAAHGVATAAWNSMQYASSGMGSSYAMAGGFTVGPGAVSVTVNNPAHGLDVEQAINRAMNRWARQFRADLRTRRLAVPGARM